MPSNWRQSYITDATISVPLCVPVGRSCVKARRSSVADREYRQISLRGYDGGYRSPCAIYKLIIRSEQPPKLRRARELMVIEVSRISGWKCECTRSHIHRTFRWLPPTHRLLHGGIISGEMTAGRRLRRDMAVTVCVSHSVSWKTV